jgi:hypothetical protein
MRKTTLTVVACALLLCAGTTHAERNATLRCGQSKLRAQGVVKRCLKENSANVLGKQARPSGGLPRKV